MFDPVLRDALQFWERRRVAYNAALGALAAAWVVSTWPHSRPAMTLGNAGRVTILAGLANLCYCAAYLVDLPAQHSAVGAAWRRRRWLLWLCGTLAALLFAHYWIGDEIYPYVDGR